LQLLYSAAVIKIGQTDGFFVNLKRFWVFIIIQKTCGYWGLVVPLSMKRAPQFR
jgi:hypothetical protein